jgi:hypothetical protein
MKVTNKLGLPIPIVKAIENDPYTNHDTLTVTTLLKPPQAYGLQLKHAGELTEDAADRIWALVGQVGHTILERSAQTMDPKVWLAEKRFFTKLADRDVSGQADLIHIQGGVVYDFKFTSGWAVINARSGKSDWRIQLSLLALLARLNGYPQVTTGKIVAIVRDWTKSTALRVRDWPEKQIETIDMDIMGHDETMDWVIDRIAQFEAAERGEWRLCTDEERWHSPGKWAVYKQGNQKASKLEDDEERLSEWIFKNRAKLGANYRIEQRPTEYRRCADYCAAAPFCQQHLSTPRASDEKE